MKWEDQLRRFCMTVGVRSWADMAANREVWAHESANFVFWYYAYPALAPEKEGGAGKAVYVRLLDGSLCAAVASGGTGGVGGSESQVALASSRMRAASTPTCAPSTPQS